MSGLRLPLGPAVRTHSVELELVAHEPEPVFGGNLMLEDLDFVVLELDDFFALDTDQMVVVLIGPCHLVP